MAYCRHWLLMLCALVLGGEQVLAAPSREERAYAAATMAFQTEMWSRAETGFAQFAQRYPKSTNAPMAVLLEAQAQFNQEKYTNAVALLTEHKDRAGTLADQYVSWIGEAQFAGSNFLAAADTFTSLMNDFPESPLRLRAAVEAASAYDQAQNWQQVISFLLQTNGVFQQKAGLDPENELVSSGRLLTARAWSRLGDPQKSLAILSAMNTKSLKLKQDAQLNQIAYDDSLAANDIPAALLAATNLVQIARLEKDNVLSADSWGRMAGLLALSGQPVPAMAAWQQNLTAGTPDEKQREAILKIAELAVGLKQFTDAQQWLETYLKQFPDSPQADIALLTVGELYLKDYATAAATNHLSLAQARFDVLLSKFPDSPLAGKVFLDRGWCWWLAGKIPDSQADFEAAAQKELSPADFAVAKFKAGDVLFAQTNFPGALENYRAVFPEVVVDDSTNGPATERDLRGRALYQSLRACLALDDTNGAADAFTKVFAMFSDGELGQDSALLYGQSLVKPPDARALFEKLAPQFSGSAQEPELKLAIAQTYEQEQNWPAAVTNYQAWVQDFPTNTSLRPQADYALAGANFQAGNETDALSLFTRFVAQYQTNALAPQAQWWVAGHFFQQGGTNYLEAEKNYEDIFQNTNAAWKSSTLIYPAQLMAGRSAMGRTGYKDAAYYFTGLINDTNCTDAYLQVQARFAYGAALMHMDSSDTNAAFANIMTATNLFSQIVQSNPTNELGARAWGEIGDCALQLGDYITATNAYAQVFNTNSTADLPARNGAQVGIGIVLEKMAAQTSGDDQTNLFSLALDNYLHVFNGENVRNEAEPDLFWTKEAGLRAAPLVGLLNDYQTETNFYSHLKLKLPQLADAIDKKVAALPSEKN